MPTSPNFVKPKNSNTGSTQTAPSNPTLSKENPDSVKHDNSEDSDNVREKTVPNPLDVPNTQPAPSNITPSTKNTNSVMSDEGVKPNDSDEGVKPNDSDEYSISINYTEPNPLDLANTQPARSNTMVYVVIGLLVLLGIGGAGMWVMTQQEEKEPKIPVVQEDAYILLDRAMCEQYKICDNVAALRNIESDPDKIEEVLNDIDTLDALSFSLSFVESNSNPQIYLAELSSFDKSHFDDIIEQQQKLRTVFLDFKKMTHSVSGSFQEAPHSGDYPVLSFVYKVSQKMPSLLKMEEHLPFFTTNDIQKAKFLSSIVEAGRDNKLIIASRYVKVFDALCQLSDEKTVKTVSSAGYGLTELCTTHDNNCENLDNDVQKQQANFFLEFRKNVHQHLECATQ